MLGWTPATSDAENSIYNLIATRGGDRGEFNLGGFSDPKIDALDQQIQVQTNEAKRDAEIDQVAEILQKDWGYIPLHQQVIIYSARNGIQLVQRPDNFFLLKLPHEIAP
jgi:peptide/nickel transport system substrate-binding protein